MRSYGQKRQNPKIKVEGTKSFSRGLSQLGHPSVIRPDELAESQNVLYTLNGVLEKRPGSKTIGDIRGSSTKLNAVQAVYGVNGQDYFLRISDDGVLQKYLWDSNLWVDVSGSPTFSNVKTAIVQAWGQVYIMNAVDNMVSWDGVTFTTNTAIDNPTVAPTAVVTGSGRIALVRVSAGGSGYSAGNILTVAGGDGNGQIKVETVAGGAVTSVSVSNPGTGYDMGVNIETTGAGTGCKINITTVLGRGTTTYYYRYAWQNASGNTVASDSVSVDKLPLNFDEETFVTLTFPAAPEETTKTMLFKGKSSGDEMYLTSVNPDSTTYKDTGTDKYEDVMWNAPTENSTNGYHFKDGIVVMYQDKLIGVTVELGDDTIVSTAGAEEMRSFGVAAGSAFFSWKKGDGSRITGLHEFQEALYVFKTNKIGAYKLSPSEIAGATLSTVSLASGAVSHDSIHAAGNDLRYWSAEGAMSLGNEPNFAIGVRTKILSARADKIVSAINPSELNKICGVYYKSHSLWGLPQGLTGQGNTTTITYNERFAAWSEWFGLSPSQFVKVFDPTNKERLFFSVPSSANILEAWSGRDDNGTPIVWRVSTKQFDAGVSYRYKTYNRVYFVFGNIVGGNTKIILTENGFKQRDPLAMYASNTGQQGFGVDQWGTIEFGTSTGDIGEDMSGITIRYADVGYRDLFSLQATFSNNGLSDTLQLMGMFFEYSDSELPLQSTYQLQPTYE